MKPLFRHITKSLAGKLIITIGLFIIIGGGISWYILIDNGRKALIDNTIQSTASYSDFISKGTRYGMLTFHRESIQQTIDSIGSTENVKGIRIFDSKGKIAYSSRHNEIGTVADQTSTACLVVMPTERHLNTYEQDNGQYMKAARDTGFWLLLNLFTMSLHVIMPHAMPTLLNRKY
jgi:hypothetical protein